MVNNKRRNKDFGTSLLGYFAVQLTCCWCVGGINRTWRWRVRPRPTRRVTANFLSKQIHLWRGRQVFEFFAVLLAAGGAHIAFRRQLGFLEIG